jgi:hypothetical protein
MENVNDNTTIFNTNMTLTSDNNITMAGTFNNNSVMTNTTVTSLVDASIASIASMADETVQAVGKLLNQASYTFYKTKQHILEGREK